MFNAVYTLLESQSTLWIKVAFLLRSQEHIPWMFQSRNPVCWKIRSTSLIYTSIRFVKLRQYIKSCRSRFQSQWIETKLWGDYVSSWKKTVHGEDLKTVDCNRAISVSFKHAWIKWWLRKGYWLQLLLFC